MTGPQKHQFELEVASYFVKHKSTVRETAKAFNLAKSTTHLLLQRRSYVDPQVRALLNNNWDERFVRGGDATRRKYLTKKIAVMQ